MNHQTTLHNARRTLPKLDERGRCFTSSRVARRPEGNTLLARITAIKPNGSGDTGMAEER